MTLSTWRGRRRLVLLLAALALSGATACDWMTGFLPENAERMDPPAVFRRWWAMTESCAGRTGDFSAVEWYRVPGASVVVDGQSAAGYWSPQRNRILLPEQQLDDGDVVRHEMLHALLAQHGHPRAEFLDLCGAVVICQARCADHEGAWRPPVSDYVVLPPDSLVVTSDAVLLPREADGTRWVTLWITVRNPRNRAVLVAAPGDPVTPATFAFDLRGPLGGNSGGDVATDSSTLFFRANEVKSRLFEFHVTAAPEYRRIPPGSHQLRGGYAGRWASFDRVNVAQ